MKMKYVRREIRQLTDADREAFFTAMETLYRLPTAEGTEEYGDEYKVRVSRHALLLQMRVVLEALAVCGLQGNFTRFEFVVHIG